MDSKKTHVIPIRINEYIKKQIDKESEIKQISTNALLNQIITGHVCWDKFTRELGMLSINRGLYEDMFSKINDEDVKIIAITSFKSAIKELTTFVYHDFNFNSLTKTMEAWCMSSHIAFKHVNNEKVKYIIHHSLGEKYSRCLYIALESLLSEIGYKSEESKIEKNNLIFEIIKKNEFIA